MADSMNPMDNLTDVFTDGGNIMKAVPLTNNIKSTWDNVMNAVSAESFDDFAMNVADAVLNWTPGGATVERVGKAVEASQKGYVESAAGRIKHAFSPDPFNVAMASLLGMGSSREGRAYAKEGYRTLSDAKTENMKHLIDDYGIDATSAYLAVTSETNEYNANAAAKKAEREGEDDTEHLEAAAEARENIVLPSDIANWSSADRDAEWFKKGIELWRESGVDVYPRDIVFEEGEVSPDVAEAINAYYRKQYKYIVGGWDGSANALKKELDAAKKRAKAKYM